MVETKTPRPYEDLLERALWLCQQIPRLHELSYDMSASDDPSYKRHSYRAAQQIMEEAAALEVDIARAQERSA